MTQKNTAPKEAGMIARRKRGRPARPTTAPITGIQTPMMTRCWIVRWNVSHPMALESNSASTHNATLRSGAEIPTKIAVTASPSEPEFSEI
jgi:hypothetical protein